MCTIDSRPTCATSASDLSPVLYKLRRRVSIMQVQVSRAVISFLNSKRTPLIFTCVSYAEARNRYRLDVCPSVCPSHVGTVSKRLNILPCFLHHTIAHSF